MGPAEKTIAGRPALSGSLRPVSVLTMQTMEVARHGHCLSLTSGQTTVQREVSKWRDELRTPYSLTHGRRDLLLYQVI